MRKAITDEELIRLVDEYAFDHPGKKIKIPAFGEYVRSKGYSNVQDHTIRRNKGCVEHIESLNTKTEENTINDLVMYKTLDVDAFMTANRNPASLKKALVERDSYYARIASNAVEMNKESKVIKAKCEELEKKNAELTAQLEKMKAKKPNNVPVKVLKKILGDYVYPEFADAILNKEGILKTEESMVPDELLETNLIDADTELNPGIIEESEFDAINALLNGITQG